MALDDQKISLSKLLARLQENRLAIKSITKLSELNVDKVGRNQALKKSLFINTGSAVGTTLMQMFLAPGFHDLPLTAIATINVWNIAKLYFSNTRLKALMDKKLSFVVKKFADNSALREELELLKEGIAVEFRNKPKTKEETEQTKQELGIDKYNRIKKDEILPGFGNQVPDPITLDVLLEMFKNGKSANYLKLKNSVNLPADKYIDLSPESKALFNEILKELRAIEKTPGWLSFAKKHQQYLAGALAAGAQVGFTGGQKAKEQKAKDEEIVKKIKEKQQKRNTPRPINSFNRVKYDPKKFGG